MTRTISHPLKRSNDPVQHFVFEDASWSFYEQLLGEIGDRPIRVTYDQGRMEIMSPLWEHEEAKRLIGRLIETLTLVLKIPVKAAAPRRSAKGRSRRVWSRMNAIMCATRQRCGCKRIDLSRDPPPDLVVEIDVTHRSVLREPIYAALGVSEISAAREESLSAFT